MLNAEKYREEILEYYDKDLCTRFGVDKRTKKIIQCRSQECENCEFSVFEEKNKGTPCIKSTFKWLLSEYTEAPIKLTRLEYEILKHVQKEGFNFIIRNNYDDLFIHETKPIKPDGSIDWCTTGKSYVLCAFNDLFQFVKFEDKDPTSVEEVLNNCEVVDDD